MGNEKGKEEEKRRANKMVGMKKKYCLFKKHQAGIKWERVGSFRFLHIAEKHARCIEVNQYMQTQIDTERRYTISCGEVNY